MFPQTYLPLNIFEPKYLSMIQNVLATENRVLGIVQPKTLNKNNSNLYQVGSAGKIIKFEETEDNTLLITLKGLYRFNIVSDELYNRFN